MHQGPGNPPDTRTGIDGAFVISAPADAGGLRFQIIYVIHGDAGYTYYDEAGERRSADIEAVAQAEEVARSSPAAEVFIFHQKPSPFLRFFRGGDGMLRHYRGGKLLRIEGYHRANREDDLGSEAALFRKHAAFQAPRTCPPREDSLLAASVAHPEGGPARFFVYFGHEIPVTGGAPYSRTRPDMAFSVNSFARGLEKFGGPACLHAKPFSLIVLSACHGGTPAATAALAPYTSHLLASPGELHLSYLDTRSLSRMARENPLPFETAHAGAWGRAIAQESFARLRAATSTAITLSLYETDAAYGYLDSRRSVWETAGTPAAGMGPRPLAPMQYRDCADNPEFGSGGEEAGVTVYYHAPRFGQDRKKGGHSGWECPAATQVPLGASR